MLNRKQNCSHLYRTGSWTMMKWWTLCGCPLEKCRLNRSFCGSKGYHLHHSPFTVPLHHITSSQFNGNCFPSIWRLSAQFYETYFFLENPLDNSCHMIFYIGWKMWVDVTGLLPENRKLLWPKNLISVELQLWFAAKNTEAYRSKILGSVARLNHVIKMIWCNDCVTKQHLCSDISLPDFLL